MLFCIPVGFFLLLICVLPSMNLEISKEMSYLWEWVGVVWSCKNSLLSHFNQCLGVFHFTENWPKICQILKTGKSLVLSFFNSSFLCTKYFWPSLLVLFTSSDWCNIWCAQAFWVSIIFLFLIIPCHLALFLMSLHASTHSLYILPLWLNCICSSYGKEDSQGYLSYSKTIIIPNVFYFPWWSSRTTILCRPQRIVENIRYGENRS